MPLKLGTLFYDIEADTSGIKKGEREVSKSASAMGAGFGKLGTAIAAAVSIGAVAKITMLADELRVAERRIQTVSDSTFEFNQNLGSLKATANATGLEFKSVFSVFEGFKRVQDDIGATDEQILDFTDNLAKLGIIGGSSQEELSNALRQLNQGLAGGILRAEEFNSIVENTPEIAQSIAKGLNVSLGELRGMVLEGELLADDVFNAILSQADETNERFEKIPKSLSQLAQETKNILIDITGELDKTTGATSALSNLWSDVNRGLQQMLDRSKDINKQDEETNKRRKEVIRAQIVELQNEINIQKTKQLNAENTVWQEHYQKKINKLNDELIAKLDELTELENRGLEIQETKTEELEKQKKLAEEVAEAQEEPYKFRAAPSADPNSAGFDIGKFIETENLKSALQEAKDAWEETKDSFGEFDELDEFESAFASMEEDMKNFDEYVRQFNEDLVMSALDSAKEYADTFEGMFSNVADMAGNFRDKELQEQIEAVEARTDLTDKEKKKTIEILKKKAKEKSGLEKAALIAERVAALASIAINTAKNVIAAGGLTPMGFAQLGFGLSQAAVVASTPLGGGREFGGEVAPNMLTPVNESGAPELLQMGNKQFLLTGDKGGRITSGAKMAANDSGPKVTVINNAAGVEVTPQVTMEEVLILVNKATKKAVSDVNRSISSNQGSTARALDARAGRRS